MKFSKNQKLLLLLIALAVVAYFVLPKSSNYSDKRAVGKGKKKWCVCGFNKKGKIMGCEPSGSDGKNCSCCDKKSIF